MITVDKKTGLCKLSGSGYDLLQDVANIAKGFCRAHIDVHKNDTSASAAVKQAKELLIMAVDAGCVEALASVNALSNGQIVALKALFALLEKGPDDAE